MGLFSCCSPRAWSSTVKGDHSIAINSTARKIHFQDIHLESKWTSDIGEKKVNIMKLDAAYWAEPGFAYLESNGVKILKSRRIFLLLSCCLAPSTLSPSINQHLSVWSWGTWELHFLKHEPYGNCHVNIVWSPGSERNRFCAQGAHVARARRAVKTTAIDHPSTHCEGTITPSPRLVPQDWSLSPIFFPSPMESLYLLYGPQNNMLTRGKEDTLPCQSFSLFK